MGTSFNFDAQWMPNIFSFVMFAIFLRHILQRVFKIVVVHLFVLRRQSCLVCWNGMQNAG